MNKFTAPNIFEMMRLRSVFLVFFAFSLLLGACCTKSKQCSILTFNELELRNFSKEELSDNIALNVFAAGSNYTNMIGSYTIAPTWNDADNTKVSISTIELSVSDDYELVILKTGTRYRIRNFTVEKVACGKCVMRNNNQFGYTLNGYSVNGTYRGYEGKILVFK